MSRTPQAAVSMVWKPYNEVEQEIYGSFSFHLNRSYADLLDNSGIVPRAIVPTDNITPGQLLENCHLLILTGGGDPDPSLFGETDQGSRNPARDRACWDIELYRTARSLDIPVLGICLGMQLIGIAHGGSLIQDIDREIENHIGHESNERKPVLHRVSLQKGSVLQAVLGNSVTVSSSHHQVLRSVPDGFTGCAFSADGLIEAIESTDGRVLGVQWHPERDSTGLLIMNRLKEEIVRDL